MSTPLQRCLEKGNFAMAEKLVNHRFRALFAEWNHKQGTRDGVHLSSIIEAEGHFCYTEHVLGSAFVRTEKDLPQSLLEVFVHGWQLHRIIQKILKQVKSKEGREALAQKILPHLEDNTTGTSEEITKEKWQYLLSSIGGIATEVEEPHYAAEHDLSFTPDALVYIQDVLFVTEIKGYRSSVWDYITPFGINPMLNPDFRKAVIQANLYMHMLGLDYSIILIENKATQKWRAWVRPYDAALAAPYIERLEKLQRYMRLFKEQAVLPQRICASIEDERARNCPLRDACFASEERLLTLFKSEEVRRNFFTGWGWEEAG